MILKELPFESVNRQTVGRTDGQKAITISHPEYSSGKLKVSLKMFFIDQWKEFTKDLQMSSNDIVLACIHSDIHFVNNSRT